MVKRKFCKGLSKANDKKRALLELKLKLPKAHRTQLFGSMPKLTAQENIVYSRNDKRLKNGKNGHFAKS